MDEQLKICEENVLKLNERLARAKIFVDHIQQLEVLNGEEEGLIAEIVDNYNRIHASVKKYEHKVDEFKRTILEREKA
jgi:hypothetical protein